MTSPHVVPRSLSELRGALAAIGTCQAVGGAGAAVSRDGIAHWLPSLDKPSFQPPNAAFGPAWTLLYTLMGLSLASVRRDVAAGPERSRAEKLFAIQLALNALWPYVFFQRRSTRAGVITAGALLLAVAATTRAIWRIHRPAAVLMLPYLAWCAFALALSVGIERRN